VISHSVKKLLVGYGMVPQGVVFKRTRYVHEALSTK